MSEWRKKAYEMFGFESGAYSYSQGKTQLFADLFEMARKASTTCDSSRLDRVFEFVMWANQQTAENLRSAADIVFFIPLFRDAALLHEAQSRLPEPLLTSKRRLTGEAAKVRADERPDDGDFPACGRGI
ncbi:MAG TPA: hypothetical protein VG711_11445 [Phycisphaerales bacterium]|nr:hypothetical protein [Phycisphaerales bacterium]